MNVRWKRSLLCVGIGMVLFLAAELVNTRSFHVENGILYRNACGKGEAVYEFYVERNDGQGLKTTLSVPERIMTEAEFREIVPVLAEVLCREILGENSSLREVRSDLNLIKELSGYGVTISWRSQMPEVVSHTGIIDENAGSPMGTEVILEATLRCGDEFEVLEIPVTVYEKERSWEERFFDSLEQLVQQNPESETVILPTEFEESPITYRSSSHTTNLFLVLLGAAAAVILHLKEQNDLQEAKKRREEQLTLAYQDLVSSFLILTGAGYSPKEAWRKMTKDMETSFEGETAERNLVLLREMKITINQMETGIPETRAYADFGKRCGIRCYIRFASLLESCVQTGGKNLRNLLEAEMEEAFKQRADLAKRKGEEASSKLLLPLFGMLSVVMVMVAAPAFLSFG